MNWRQRERFARAGLLLPTVLYVLLIAVVPIGATVCLAFRQQMPIFGISRFTGLENFRFLWEDARFWRALGHTAYFTGLAVSLELALGLGLALLFHRDFRGRNVARALALIPWAVPTVVAARFWEWIFNADFGVLNYLLGAHFNWLGNPVLAMHAVVLADVWKSTPFVLLLLLAGLQVIPRELYLAARVDGASNWQLFWHITLPLLRPVILLVLLFRTMDAARVFDLVFVLTGGGPANETETLVVYAYKLMYRTLQFGYGSTVALATFAFILTLSLAYLYGLRRVWQLRQ